MEYGGRLLTSTQVAALVGITKGTLLRWYAFKEAGGTLQGVELPEYISTSQGDFNLIRYWKEDDIQKIKIYKEKVPKGRGGLINKSIRGELKKEKENGKK